MFSTVKKESAKIVILGLSLAAVFVMRGDILSLLGHGTNGITNGTSLSVAYADNGSNDSDHHNHDHNPADPCTLTASQFHADLQDGSIVASAVTAGASGTAMFSLTNHTNCSAPVSLASYKMFVAVNGPNWLSTQQFIAVSSETVATPSSTTTFTVPTVSCETQVDAYYGTPVPTNLLDTNPYGYPNVPFVFAWAFIGSPLCSVTPPTPPSADLAIVKTANVTSTTEGGTVDYTLTVSALGPATSTGVVATDTLPSGLTFVSASATIGSYASGTGTWTIGNMSASTTAILEIVATVNAGTAGTTITNTATVCESASTTDPNENNNSSSVSITVQPNTPTVPNADISIVKTADVTSTVPGDAVNYTLTVTALGPATSTGVVATDTLPTGLDFVSATTSQGTYAPGTGTWTIGDMSASSTATLDIKATVNAGTAGTTITNSAMVSENGSSTDQNPGNNSSTVPVVITTPACTSNCGGGGGGGGTTPTSTIADLSIAKTADVTSTVEGGTINYTLTVTALGPATSTFVLAQDILPAGLSLSMASASQGTYDMSTGKWNVGQLAPNATATLVLSTMVGAGTAGTTITNTATVSELSSLVDNNSANNSSSISVAVQSASGGGGNSGGGGGGGGGGGNSGGGGSAYEIAINGGALTTPTTSVTLSLYGTDAYTMELSNTSSFASSTWIPYATVMPWVLTNGAGEKTVYVQYRSISGTIVGSANASIQLLGGEVLGASTTCGIYLNDYIKLGAQNDPAEVDKLQIFLNENLGVNLPITGFYGADSYAAVRQFQVKYHGSVLLPWVPHGLPTQLTPTGYVYKTTKWWINTLECASLGLPQPQLP